MPSHYTKASACGSWPSSAIIFHLESPPGSPAVFGLPGRRAFTSYAWNEFGEGGIVAPTRSEGMVRLEASGAVFGF
ncbi:MAG TPA: hypothetical protein PKY01_04780 [Candidatus Hydrogenedentes bacterium]|nr:hypothetical protein [Candidatus Hydrogenedentota bacterium]